MLFRVDILIRWCSLALLATLCLCEEQSTEFRQTELIEPPALAKNLESNDPPFILCVSDPESYRSRRLPNAIFAGPAGKPQGLELLKAAASAFAKDDSIVIYCGCCALAKCPNVRPAFRQMKEMGFTHVRVLDIMSSMDTEWYNRGYPVEKKK